VIVSSRGGGRGGRGNDPLQAPEPVDPAVPTGAIAFALPKK
jgi:hypothetical protein